MTALRRVMPLLLLALLLLGAAAPRERLSLRVEPLFSVSARPIPVRVVLLHEGAADTLLAGITGANYERTSSQPRRSKQTVIEWSAVPNGVYTVYAIAYRRGEQVATVHQEVHYGVAP
jgi:hypothetical protein